MSVNRQQLRRDVEELLSESYGKNIRLIVAVDDTNVDKLTLSENGLKETCADGRLGCGSRGSIFRSAVQRAG